MGMKDQRPPIALHAEEPIRRIAPENVYFAFPNSAFRYDCVECGAKCCRGHGYHQHAQDLRFQVEQRHALKLFLDKPRGSSRPYYIQNLAPSCFFLSETGRCEIQENHGYGAKPETCRLFPFNHWRRAGEFLIVAPHMSLCPLQVCRESQGSCSDHDNLYREMAAFGIHSAVPETVASTGDVEGTIRRELRIRAAAESLLAAPTYRECAVEQLRATISDEQAWNPEAVRYSIEKHEHCLFQVLGVKATPEAMSNESLTTAMIAITPVIRAELLFLTKGNGHPLQPLVPLSRIPYLLLTLNAFGALAIDAGMRSISYQTLTALFIKSQALLAMLACVDLHVRWQPSSMAVWPLKHDSEFEAGYLRVIRPLMRDASTATLGELLAENAPTDVLKRTLFLGHVARALFGRVSSAPERSFKDRWRPRAVLQRAALQHLSISLLETIAERMSPSRTGHVRSA